MQQGFVSLTHTMGRKKKYDTKEERLEARRVKERQVYRQQKDQGVPMKQAIHLSTPDIVLRWNQLREQQGLSSHADVARFLLDR